MSSEIYYSLAIYDGNGQSSMLSWWFLESPLKVGIFQFSMDFMAIPSHFPIETWGFSKNIWYQDVDMNITIIYIHTYKSINSDIPLYPLSAQLLAQIFPRWALHEFDLPIATWPPGSAEELLQELSSGSTLSLRQGVMGGRGWGPPKKRRKNEGKSAFWHIFPRLTNHKCTKNYGTSR